jgi:hypothetical protein
LRRRGLGLAAISYDSPEVLRAFADRKRITFPLLSDRDSTLIRRFRILNEQVPKNSPFHGIPHPVTYLVDAKGRILSRHFEEDFRRRPTVGYVLSDAVTGPNGTAFRDPKLSIRASATDSTVRGGERIRLFLDIQLGPRMHVYAPGVQGYIPVSWTQEVSTAAETDEPRFPQARRMHLKAIGETVPVYEGSFRLHRDVSIGDSKNVEKSVAADGTLVLRGVFRYQACDDRKCYVPEDVPIQWTFRYEPHDATRAPPGLRRR